MALFRWALVLVMALIAMGSVAYSLGLMSTDGANAASVLYHCPMHPQVVQDHPGECPICGMTLVKAETPGAAAKGAPTFLFEAGDGLVDLLPEAVGSLAFFHDLAAGVGRDREARRNPQTQSGHLRQSGPFATQEIAHRRVSF